MPIPEPDEVAVIYGEEYYSVVKPDYIQQVEEDAGWHRMTFRARLSRLEGMVNGRRILEVGSGPGLFLAEARDRGWQEQGYEPSPEAHTYASKILGVNVTRQPFASDEPEKYDAAYLGLVLEHIPDPIRLVTSVQRSLKPDGILCVAVPNDFSPLQALVNQMVGGTKKQWWVAPPHHINYFSFESLSRLLSTCGFEIAQKEGTFPLEFFIPMGMNYIDDPELGRACHTIRMKLEGLLENNGLTEFKNEACELLAKYGMGRECVVYARKKQCQPNI
jgi:SAM-dependent methyltransferase